MIRRTALIFTFFSCLAAGNAMAKDTISEVMQCIATCNGAGFGLESCVSFCVD